MRGWEQIKLTGSALQHGESERGVCPFCHGGRTHEESFLVTRRGPDIAYTCFRASCGKWGVISGTGAPEKRDPYPERRGKVLRAPTFPLSDEVLGELYKKYELSPGMVEYYRLTMTAEQDIVIPVYDSKGRVQAHERKIRNPQRTKAVLYPSPETDGINWYNTMPAYLREIHRREFMADSIILVEDSYSAMKANVFMHSIALLGTYLPMDAAAKLAGMGYRRILIALDADATQQAARLKKRYRAMLPQLQVFTLLQDIKDTPFINIRSMLCYSQQILA